MINCYGKKSYDAHLLSSARLIKKVYGIKRSTLEDSFTGDGYDQVFFASVICLIRKFSVVKIRLTIIFLVHRRFSG